jgi:hypothetical protein
MIVRCGACEQFRIASRLADQLRAARRMRHVATLEKCVRLSIEAARAWRDGGRLNIFGDNWERLAEELRVDGSLEAGHED